MSDQPKTTEHSWPKTPAECEARARELFQRAKEANDPDMRDVFSAAAWYYADHAEHVS